MKERLSFEDAQQKVSELVAGSYTNICAVRYGPFVMGFDFRAVRDPKVTVSIEVRFEISGVAERPTMNSCVIVTAPPIRLDQVASLREFIEMLERANGLAFRIRCMLGSYELIPHLALVGG
jgi:hypothetical protein